MTDHVDALRLFVSFPESLVDKPMIYEMIKRYDVVPNIRRANVEAHSGWVMSIPSKSRIEAILNARRFWCSI